MNTKNYDHVVEVKKHVKKPWYTKCLDFSIEEDMDFMQEMSVRQKNYYLCEVGGRTYLIDSDNHKDEVLYLDLTNFIEIEIDGYVYRKYRALK